MTLRFLSRGEIAERLGVSLGTVKQYANFPEPDVIVGRNQGWSAETVDRWQRARVQSGAEPGRKPVAVAGAGGKVRAVPAEVPGDAPASLSAPAVSGAGAEATHRIGDAGIDLAQRPRKRGVGRRGGF